MKKVAIYGAGNFGYALLNHFDKKAEPMNLSIYEKNVSVRSCLKDQRCHVAIYPEHQIGNNINVVDTVAELVDNIDVLVLAVSSSAVREVIKEVSLSLKRPIIILNTAKALEANTGKRMSVVIAEEMGDLEFTQAILAGGTIAADFFNLQPLGATIASEDSQTLEALIPTISSHNLFIYPSNDLIGVEYASAFKNIISILAGILNGKGYSYGAETHVISRAAYEIETIVTTKLGGQRETFLMNSQCWGNDLWMSCTGKTRNREFGFLIGQGMSPEEAERKMFSENKTIEGVETLKSILKVVDIDNYPLVHFLATLITKKSDINQLESVLFNK